MLIRVIGRLHRQMPIENTSQFEIPYGILDGRTGLQQHAPLNAVQIETGDERHLPFVMTLAFHDGRNDRYLDRRQSDRVRFRPSLRVPEPFILTLHALEELLRRDIPIYFVGIGDKQTPAGLFVKSVWGKKRLIFQTV